MIAPHERLDVEMWSGLTKSNPENSDSAPGSAMKITIVSSQSGKLIPAGGYSDHDREADAESYTTNVYRILATCPRITIFVPFGNWDWPWR